MSLLLSGIKRCGTQADREQRRQGTPQALAEVVSGSAVMVSHVDQCVVNSPVGRIAVRVCLQPGYSSNLSGWQGNQASGSRMISTRLLAAPMRFHSYAVTSGCLGG